MNGFTFGATATLAAIWFFTGLCSALDDVRAWADQGREEAPSEARSDLEPAEPCLSCLWHGSCFDSAICGPGCVCVRRDSLDVAGYCASR
jgi:hypothetical protein